MYYIYRKIKIFVHIHQGGFTPTLQVKFGKGGSKKEGEMCTHRIPRSTSGSSVQRLERHHLSLTDHIVSSFCDMRRVRAVVAQSSPKQSEQRDTSLLYHGMMFTTRTWALMAFALVVCLGYAAAA